MIKCSNIIISGRITPADAGKTVRFKRQRCAQRDHPRGCGENCSSCRDFHGVPGSPPRMRGKPSAAKTHGVYTGITPADAGKTDPGAWMRYQGVGSPPRMRGKLFLLSTSCCAFGITPADAGKTYRREMKKKELRDHPRGCGENFLQSHIQNVRTGSPPRMRGKLHIRACVFYSVGITPADAGKTLQRAYAVKSVRDHPRGCGENAATGSEAN